ncbi:MAG: hypothetical protein U9Q33_04665 [Campylobacterota bacterium]|nr:hypothetical protein [Campylobacterota bacterium]
MFWEIYFIQKFILFLGNPVIIAAVVLSSFLIFAGLGSGYSNKMGSSRGFKTSVKYAVGIILLLCTVYLFTLN